MLPGDREERDGASATALHARRQAYAAIPHQVNTTGLTPDQMVDDIFVALAADVEVPGMTRIPVREAGRQL